MLSYEPGTGGAATYQAYQIDFLLTHGHQVVFVDERPEFTLANVKQSSALGFRVLTAPVWANRQQTIADLNETLASTDVAVISLCNPGVLIRYYPWLIRQRRRGRRVVITMHSGMLTMTTRRYLLEWAASLAILGLADVTYVSWFTRRYWENRYPWTRLARARVVPNGVDIPLQLPVKQRKINLQVGFIGRLSSEKDPRLYCQVARLAQTAGLPFEFCLAGDGPLRLSLEQEFGSALIWLPPLTIVSNVYSSIDLLMMTSPVENCPYVLLEAKSNGVPVVAASVGGIPEIVVSGVDGCLTAIRSPDALLAALVEAGRSHEELVKGCLENRSRYDVKHQCHVTWSARGIMC
jgi:glycosyltransferase involved in cell wall biosynthesis